MKNKSFINDERIFNLVRYSFGELCDPLKYLLDSFLTKTVTALTVFKASDTGDICSASVLSFF